MKSLIRQNTVLIINTIIPKPVFDTQLKETLKTLPKYFQFELSDLFLKNGSHHFQLLLLSIGS
jgi:hypothetical protein